MKSVYIVYSINIKKNDFDDIEVFTNYNDAKDYVNASPNHCCIWQRPLREKEIEKC